MKSKFMTVIFLILFFCDASYCQNSWNWQNVLPQGNDLLGVKMFDSNKVVAAGGYGTVIRSEDGGIVWEIISTPTHNTLYGLDVLSNGVCVAVGSSGTIIRSVDYGKTWNTVASSVTKTLYGVRMGSRRGITSSGYGYIVGSQGTLLRTTDFGASWTTLSSGGTTSLYAAAYDNNFVYIAGASGLIRRSADYGSTWMTHTTNITTTLYSLSADSLSGIAVGEHAPSGGNSVILRMINSDTVWTLASTSALQHLRSVNFWTGDMGMAVGDMGTIVATYDSGKTWQTSSVNNEMLNISAVGSAEDSIAIIVGAHGTMYKTKNTGRDDELSSWSQLHHGRPITWYGLAFSDQYNGIAAGVGGLIFQTTDGGDNWVQHSTGGSQFLDVTYCTHDIAYAVGWYGGMYYSADGGTNWHYQLSGATADLQAVRFQDSVGYAVGLSGTIIRARDWGGAWTVQTSPLPTINFYDAAVLNTDTALIFGDKGYILRTTDKGNTWATTRVDTTMTIYAAYFTSKSTGTIAGSKGRIYHTTDCGTSWLVQPTSLSSSTTFTSASFASMDVGMITSYSGVLIKTTDGGTTWFRLSSGTSNSLQAVVMVNSNIAYLAGDYGTILMTTDGGGSEMTGVKNRISETVPTKFSLDQNYPNPFNPVTKIQFTVPQTAYVRLRVYNILGQEIAKLFEGIAKVDSYHQVEFNASRYASGIYLYTLEYGNQRLVKKMMLLK